MPACVDSSRDDDRSLYDYEVYDINFYINYIKYQSDIQ
jgi:hypothetical protein